MRTTQTLDYSEAKKIIDLIVNKALQMQKAAVIAMAAVHHASRTAVSLEGDSSK
jgi:hypothetical protein